MNEAALGGPREEEESYVGKGALTFGVGYKPEFASMDKRNTWMSKQERNANDESVLLHSSRQQNKKQAFDQGEAGKAAKHEVPPKRPDQDVQVEQFLRNQYHSKSGDRMPNSDSKD